MDETLKKRIENCLKELAVASDILIATLEWGPSNFEIGPGAGIQPAGLTQYPLAVRVGKTRKVAKFTEDELADCTLPGPRGTAAWQNLEHRIKEFLEEFPVEKKRIGF